MPRTSGVYSEPAGTKGTPNTTIQSAPYNAFIDDLVADLNGARPITAGGTGATNATAAREALGLKIGTNIQAYDELLQAMAGLVTVADRLIYTTGPDTVALTTLSSYGRSLIDDADAAAARTTLGLGSLAIASTINNSNWSGADLAIENGGTGASSAAAARAALGLSAIDALQTDGNVIFSGGMAASYGAALSDALNARVKNDGGNYNINIAGAAGYLKRSGTGTSMRFDYSGQPGQPAYVWGSNSAGGETNEVWNPSNFSVARAASAGNADALAGLDANSWARVSFSGLADDVNLPMGSIVAFSGGVYTRNSPVALRLSTASTAIYVDTGAGALLSGVWRVHGRTSSEQNLAQRVPA